jgi:LPS-assembly lipoprotein
MQFFAYKRLLVVALLGLTTACGFHLRKMDSLPFDAIYVRGGTPAMQRDIKRQLAGGGVKVVESAEDAQAALELMGDRYEKRIMSLSGKGLVREYELIYNVTFRVRNSPTENWGPPQTVEQRRDFTYDDTQLLAKDAEEQRLISDMRSEAVREILRRVGSLSKQAATAK